jgi:transcription antitermination factor NusG
MEETKNWYALYTRPRHEKIVLRYLEDDGRTAYLPLQKTLQQWSDRKKWVEKPLFHSYVFVYCADHEFHEIKRTFGVVKFVSLDGSPAKIPQQQIDQLKLLINSNEQIEVNTEDFTAGVSVEVTHGSLKGLTGELVNIDDKNRVAVRIDHLHQNVMVSIPVAFLKRIHAN